ncbi:MAG: bifunctional protein GlmU [Candidatus Micrarchaeota archaeon]|nr:MAG: bifunctional protein GlmU [Candidatus Micrarchaeota archaeon]
MKLLLLCGGFAKRLEPITEFIPKPLLPVAGKPLLDHIIDNIMESKEAKFERVIISSNMRFKKNFEYYKEVSKRLYNRDIELVIEPVIDNAEKLGAVKGIEYAIRKAGIDDDLLIVAGDNYFDFNLDTMIQEFNRARAVYIALYDIKSLEDAKAFGVVSINDNKEIYKFVEKPENPESTLVSTGIYIFPKEQLSMFNNYLNSNTDVDAIGKFIEWLIKQEKIKGHVFNGEWYDIGNITLYRKLFYSKL